LRKHTALKAHDKYKYNKFIHKIKNIDDCWNLCENDQADCNAITYNHIENSCYLYSDGKRASGTNKNYTSYVRKSEIKSINRISMSFAQV